MANELMNTFASGTDLVTRANFNVRIEQGNTNFAGLEVEVDTKATTDTYTATLPFASWTGASAPYTKAVTVTGILATDTPILDIVPTGTYATDVLIETDWAKVYRAVSTANTITFYAHTVPTVDIPFMAQVVR